MNRSIINFPLLIVVGLSAAVLFGVGWQRLTIDTDIISALPHDDPILDNALHIFRHHPMQDQITIDVSVDRDDPDLLVAVGQAVAAELQASGLFTTVGMPDMQELLPQLLERLIGDLPVLFSARDLQQRVGPRLAPGYVDATLQNWQRELLQLGAIGQAGSIGRDPLGFRDILLARLLNLAPSSNAGFYKGQLISNDGRHLLLTAVPAASSTDTAAARQLTDLVARTTDTVRARFAAQNKNVALTAVGAYRAALDNETLIRRDVQNAVVFATLGIAVLLLLAFPRPLIGLLSLFPAIVGTLCALFLWSLFFHSISIMVLGFGGAIISITVDHGIAYLLFLDRPQRVSGKTASREVWAVGLLATLTTMGAFLALTLSSFSVFRQLGLFAALGIGLSFLFVHTIFPLIFPTLDGSPARRLPLPRIADRLFSFGPRGAWAALLFFIVMAFFAKPVFNTDPSKMNTVSRDSMAAEKHMTAVWGDIFSKVFLLTESTTMAELQARGDRLLAEMESDPRADLAGQAFVPAMFFPGLERRRSNLTAWKEFWQPEKIDHLQRSLAESARRYGFSPDGFAPFFETLRHPEAVLADTGIPDQFFSLLGIAKYRSADTFYQFATLTLPPDYPARSFFDRYSPSAAVFESSLFSRQLGSLMMRTFGQLLLIIAPAIAVLLLLFFLDLGLTLIALAPVAFAMVCTLGTLKLIGRPVDIPTLIMAVIVLGMGIDYSLFLVRSFQRYGRAADPMFALIRSAVVMTSASTLIGFGVLAFARHSLLQSAGITSLLGIGYSALGAFLILPPLLKRRFEPSQRPESFSGDLHARIRSRFKAMEPYVRLFARFKLKIDPMFRELSQVMRFRSPPEIIIDVGSGYGVPASWLVESYGSATVYGIEPSAERVRAARRALAARGSIVEGMAPDVPTVPGLADGAIMLDMIHFLSPGDLQLVLGRLSDRLKAGGLLVIRAAQRPARDRNRVSWLEALKLKSGGHRTCHHPAEEVINAMSQAGFALEARQPSGKGDQVWFIGRKPMAETARMSLN